MKFIHCADVHLGSPFESLPYVKAKERQSEVLTAFFNMVAYARRSDINTIVIAGDLFDSDVPREKDKNFFIDIVAKNPDIRFLYLRGNHDDLPAPELPNLLTFGKTIRTYSLGECNFSGIEASNGNHSNVYDQLDLRPDVKNVLILHGELGGQIDLNKLKNKNIDYLALGHIHKYYSGKIDQRGVYVNCGCLEGRGFDECGEKGFIVVDTDDFKYTPIVNSLRVVRSVSIDIGATHNEFETLDLVKTFLHLSSKDILKLELIGEIDFDGNDLDKFITAAIQNDYYYVTVKNSTTLKINVEEYINDPGIKGEFVRCVLSDQTLKDAEKNNVLDIGLKLLRGQKI